MSFITDNSFSWIQNNTRDYSKDPAAKNFFAGTHDMDQNNLDAYNPFVQGYAYWIWTKLPKFFTPEMARKFKYMTERNFKSFSGLGNVTLDTDTVASGFTGNTYDAATNIKKPEGSFTLKHQEYIGSPIRKLYEYWIYAIRDVETGLATYHGKILSGELDYSIANHTGEGMYIVTDPSGAMGKNSIEYSAYYTNVCPTEIPQDHLNFNVGDHGLTEVDIPFKAVWHRGEATQELAAKLLKTRVVLPSFGKYGDPNTNNQQSLVGNAVLGEL